MSDENQVGAQSDTQPAGHAPQTEADAAAGADQKINGRSVFAVETTAGGILVRTAFLADDQRLLNMPAMFPSLNYALQQIDELRQLVSQHFAVAAQVGAKVIAAHAEHANANPASVQTTASTPAANS